MHIVSIYFACIFAQTLLLPFFHETCILQPMTWDTKFGIARFSRCAKFDVIDISNHLEWKKIGNGQRARACFDKMEWWMRVNSCERNTIRAVKYIISTWNFIQQIPRIIAISNNRRTCASSSFANPPFFIMTARVSCCCCCCWKKLWVNCISWKHLAKQDRKKETERKIEKFCKMPDKIV